MQWKFKWYEYDMKWEYKWNETKKNHGIQMYMTWKYERHGMKIKWYEMERNEMKGK